MAFLNIQRDPRFSELIEQLRRGLRAGTSPVLLLPDLQVSQCRITPVGGELVLNVDILNSGNAKAGPFWVEVTVDINPAPPQPLLPGQPPQTRFGPFRQRCQELPAGGVQRFRPFPLGLQNPGAGYFVQACIVVDPPTDASPGGEIWESDEMNNTDCCGVYTTPQEPEPPLEGL